MTESKLEGDFIHNKSNSTSMLEWAFAGISKTTDKSTTENGIDKPQYSVWEHWIDSKSNDPPVDEGDMWPQTNGDVLERGIQVDPVTGIRTEYEELWTDLEVEAVNGEKDRISMVLKAEGIKNRQPAKGLIVRVGGWCQGIMKIGEEVTIERWQWLETKGKWERVVAIGNSYIPCTILLDKNNSQTQEFSEMVIEELHWQVIERYRC